MKLPELYILGCPHRPTPIQWLALGLPHKREMLFGGAAGGGKTDWLLMGALQFIDVPEYTSIIFRRTYKQLAAPDGPMQRMQSWLEGHPDFVGRDPIEGLYTRWRYKGGGMHVFSHLEHEKNKIDHQGAGYHHIGFDELTQFTEGMYLYLMSRLRRAEGFPIPLRVRCTSNPGGIGHDWVKERFPIPVNGENRRIPGRTFVPSKLKDNPHLNRTEYAATLSEMHPFERQQLLDGDWDARPPGGRFKREWFEVVDEAPPPSSQRLRYYDLAATVPKPGRDPDWSVGSLWDSYEGDRYLIDVDRFRLSPGDIDDRLIATAKADGPGVTTYIEEEGGASGKIASRHFEQLFAKAGLAYPRFDRPTGDKVVRSNAMAAGAEKGYVKLVSGLWVPAWLAELEQFPTKGIHDDQVDSASGGYNKLALPTDTSWEDLYGEAAMKEREANGAGSEPGNWLKVELERRRTAANGSNVAAKSNGGLSG